MGIVPLYCPACGGPILGFKGMVGVMREEGHRAFAYLDYVTCGWCAVTSELDPQDGRLADLPPLHLADLCVPPVKKDDPFVPALRAVGHFHRLLRRDS